MFRQEQLARFGNVHILYPSLSKANYYELIKKTINSICDQIYKESGFKIEVQQSLHDLIYRNGVFPAQGARPLFQTISKVFNSIVPDILSNMIKTDNKNCCIIANNETSNIELILPNNNDNIINYHIDCDIDKIKHHTDPNRESIIAIHEAGHAIAFMDIFEYTPTQICINKVNQNGTGFTSTSIVEHTINNNLKQIIIKLSGYLTEELVLGKDHVSCGYYSDLLGATNIAANLIRSFGINPSTYGTMSIGEDNQLTDINKTDSLITDILNECKERASKLVYQHQDEIKSLSKLLLDKKNVKATEIHEIMKNYFPNLKIPGDNQIVGIVDYSNKIGGWLNSSFSTPKKRLRSSKKTKKDE
jgi:cell division protease FtsH